MSGTRIASVSGLRGIVGDGLDPAAVVEFAAAYASECGPGPIVVGNDGRVTAPLMTRAVIAGVTATGHEVHDLGAASTPTMGLFVRENGAAGGIQISASHNPPEYNGLKFFQPEGMVLDAASGRRLLDRFERKDLNWVPWNKLGMAISLAHAPDWRVAHLARVFETVNVEAIRERKFRVILDACHGAGGQLGRDLLDELATSSVILGGDPDGLYDHPPEPTAENLRSFCEQVRTSGAHVGFAQDPDADRLAIVDETGRYIGEELTLALAAQHVLAKTPGPIVLNLSTSRAAEDIARSFGCPVERTPVGEIHVVTRMREVNAVLGGEGNGGVIDPRVGFVRDSFSAMALVLDLMAETGKPLSALVDALPRYAMIKEKYPLAGGSATVGDLLGRLAESYPDAKVDRRDGLHLSWPHGWAHVRASNTEPIVRVITEAPTPEQARQMADTLGRAIQVQAD